MMTDVDRDLSIVVLAAGQGTRMRSELPKVLHTIGGKPMLAHVVAAAKALEPQQIVVVYGYNGQILKEAFQDEKLIWVEQAKQQGTGDAVAKALPVLPENHRVMILVGDVPLMSAQTLQNLLNATPRNAMGVLTVNVSAPFGLGRIVRDEKGTVLRIVEERDASDIEQQIREVNTGIFVVEAKHLNHWLPKLNNKNKQGEYYLTDIVGLATSDNVPIVTIHPSAEHEVLGVNDRVQQIEAERQYQRHLATEFLKEGVLICDPERFDLRGTLKAESDVKIDVNVILEGEVTLRKGAQIGPHCVLINCDIGEGATLLAHSHLEGVKVGNKAVVGPFARLRPGTVLGEKVRIGNFVEIKDSIVGEGTKINHLSYIGDTTIGKAVNIGAGTITCNYDGANKYQTIIEDDVLIGSDTQLVAPVRIGKGATIGAGSTVNKDAPENQLTLTQQLNQRSKLWERPKKASTEDKK